MFIYPFQHRYFPFIFVICVNSSAVSLLQMVSEVSVTTCLNRKGLLSFKNQVSDHFLSLPLAAEASSPPGLCLTVEKVLG